jgi:hypothetical protein
MVIYTANSGFTTISVPSNTVRFSFLWTAPWRWITCCAITDNTSILIRLNSSKHAHAPDDAKPLKNLPL